MPEDQITGDPRLATTWGNYAAVVLDPALNTLSTPHDYARAELFRTMAPFLYQGAKFTRSWAEYAGELFARENFDGVADLAAGVPVQGYLHTQVSADTPVLYNDNDPTVVTKSLELIGNLPNVRYTHHDLADIDYLINVAEQHFRGRRVGWILVGSLYFLPDDAVRSIFRRLHEWSAPGTLLAISGFVNFNDDPRVQPMIAMMKDQGVLPFGREPEQMLALADGWQVHTPIRLLEDLLAEISSFRDLHPEYRNLRGYGGILSR